MYRLKCMESKREIVIVVDDDITNLTVTKNNLTDKYDVFTVPSGEKLFRLLEKVRPALILLDIEMPEMDGYEVIKILKSVERTACIPVVFLTGKHDPESEVKGLDLGAVDYIMKPFSRELLLKRVELHIVFEAQKNELKNYSHSLEGEVSKQTKAVLELQSAILKTVAELVECRDSITGGHIERTQKYLSLLMDSLLKHDVYTEELLSWDAELFILSSQLHDVGKISIKDDILMKPDQLTSEEFEEIKKHTIFGMEIIEKMMGNTSENSFLQYAKVMAGCHHEKWDGSGYPFGLKGLEIPLQGRMMAIVDVYDALTNDRPYKKALTHEESVEILRSGIGTFFDPILVDMFISYEKEFKNVAFAFNNPICTTEIIKCADKSFNSTFKVVSNIMDIRGGMKKGHTERMKRYLEVFINVLLKHESFKEEVSGWDIDIFLMSAQLHDIGKIAVADHLLNKSDTLTEDEYEELKTHTDLGFKIVQQIKENINDASLLYHAEALAGHHHEKWDGTGYPHGLKGKGIPLQGRLMGIVDVYDALTNDRPHRGMIFHREAVDIIKSLSGKHFDPELVEVFLEHEKEFEKVRDV